MEPKKLTELTDQELLHEAKKMRNAAIVNAVFIGFLMGIIFYSAFKNAFGLFMLIPLFFVYKLTKKSDYPNKELEELLKERNLK